MDRRSKATTGWLRAIALGLGVTGILAAGERPAWGDQVFYRKQVIGKQCGGCGAPAPMTTHPGQTCPSCGALWAAEQEKVVGSTTTTTPRPVAPPRIAAAPKQTPPTPSKPAVRRSRLTHTPEDAKRMAEWKVKLARKVVELNPAAADHLRNVPLTALVTKPNSPDSRPKAPGLKPTAKSAEVEESAMRVLESSRGCEATARNAAVHLVRHPDAGVNALPGLPTRRAERARMLRAVAEILRNAGLDTVRFPALRTTAV